MMKFKSVVKTNKDLKKNGYKMIRKLHKMEKKKGAEKAYLQVVEGNTPARTLYESLGLKYLYTYWFRVQTL